MSKPQIKVSFLKNWGEGRDFGDEPLDLDVCSTIYNRKKFFESHIAVLEAGKDRDNKKVLIPYYHRLLQFYDLVENEKKRL